MKPALLAVAALLLASCASYDGHSLRPGVSTEAELRATMGNPAVELVQPDGGRRLAYPRGPLGTQSFIAEVGPDRVLRSVRQVLHDDNFQAIQPGWTREEVLGLIGPPAETMHFPRLRHVAWDYRYVDTWGYLAIFSVTFDDAGRVVGKISRRLERPRIGL